MNVMGEIPETRSLSPQFKRSRATRRNPPGLLPSGSDPVSERKRPPDSRPAIWRPKGGLARCLTFKWYKGKAISMVRLHFY